MTAADHNTDQTNQNDEFYNQLAFYTLSHGDAAFIHQHVVDAFAAWSADESTKGIKISFALLGLYLHLERGLTGRQVQREHMRLAKHRRQWPKFDLPADRGKITPSDVLAAAPGPDRDRCIDAWCASVWAAYGHVRSQVVELFEAESH
jgi:hypothetical protein